MNSSAKALATRADISGSILVKPIKAIRVVRRRSTSRLSCSRLIAHLRRSTSGSANASAGISMAAKKRSSLARSSASSTRSARARLRSTSSWVLRKRSVSQSEGGAICVSKSAPRTSSLWLLIWTVETAVKRGVSSMVATSARATAVPMIAIASHMLRLIAERTCRIAAPMALSAAKA